MKIFVESWKTLKAHRKSQSCTALKWNLVKVPTCLKIEPSIIFHSTIHVVGGSHLSSLTSLLVPFWASRALWLIGQSGCKYKSHFWSPVVHKSHHILVILIKLHEWGSQALYNINAPLWNDSTYGNFSDYIGHDAMSVGKFHNTFVIVSVQQKLLKYVKCCRALENGHACTVRLKGIKCSPISFWPSCKLHSCTACKFQIKAVIKNVNGPLLSLKDTWSCCCAQALFTLWQHHTLSQPWWKQKLFALRKCSDYMWCNLPSRQSMLDTCQFSCPPFINHAFVSWKTPGGPSVSLLQSFVLLAWHDLLCQC